MQNGLTTLYGKVFTSRQIINTLISLVGINLFISVMSFVTTLMIANVLGRKLFGDFSFSVAVGTYGLMFIQYGLEKSLVRELVHYESHFGELFKASLVVKFTLFLFFVLIAIIMFMHFPGYSWGVLLIIFATAFSAFQLNSVYDAWRQMTRHAIYFLIEKSIFFALVWIVFLTPFLLSLELIGMFMISSTLIGLLFQYKWALPRIDFNNLKRAWSSIFFLLRSNFFIWLAVLSGLSIDYLSQIILKLSAGSEELGTYSAAWKITQVGTLFLAQAGRIGAEATARYTRPEKSSTDRKYFLFKYITFMTIIGFLLGLPCFLFPQYLLMLFSSEYANAKETLRLFSFYPLLFGPYLAILQYIIAARMQKTYFTLITIVGFVSIGLSFYLIPQLQSKGAVISVIVSLAIALIFFITAISIHLNKLTKAA